MGHFICEQCGIGFKRSKSGKRPIRFCGQPCYHAWRKENNITTGQFEKNHTPWNKDLKGIHLSPETEFKKGQESNRKLPVGSVRIRSFKRSKRKQAFVKIAEPDIWKLRCVVVWEERFGPIPKGLILHHIDRDTLNDSLTNLCLMSRASHMREHRHEFEEKRLEGLLSRKRNST